MDERKYDGGGLYGKVMLSVQGPIQRQVNLHEGTEPLVFNATSIKCKCLSLLMSIKCTSPVQSCSQGQLL